MALFSRDATAFGPGDLIADRYRITGVLGRGAFGAVYAGEHTGTEQAVAIKMLASASGDGEARERFFREARITAKLSHPNTVRVFDVGEVEDGPTYIVMELLRGPTVEQILAGLAAKDIGMSETQAIALLVPVLSSLSEAHAAGLVHRDLKPANLMVQDVTGSEPVVKVLDFGCSHTQGSELTAQGAVLGTPGYMSPEQCLGDEVAATSDLYAVTVILYRCVTGRLPFDTNQPLQLIYKHAHEPIPDPRARATDRHVSDPMAEVLLKGLAKKPGDRYASAREMQRSLEQIRQSVNNAPVNLGGDGRTLMAGSPVDGGRQLVSLMLFAVDGYRAPDSHSAAPHAAAPHSDAAHSAATYSAATHSADPPQAQPLGSGPTSSATVMRAPAEPWHRSSLDAAPAPTVVGGAVTSAGDGVQATGATQPAARPANAQLVIGGAILLAAIGLGVAFAGGSDGVDGRDGSRGDGGAMVAGGAASSSAEPGAAPGSANEHKEPVDLQRESELRMAARHVDLARAATALETRVRHLIEAGKLAPENEKYVAELKAATAQQQAANELAARAAKPAKARRPARHRHHRKTRSAPTRASAPGARPKKRIPAAILEE